MGAGLLSRILALETSTSILSVAVVVDGECRGETFEAARGAHGAQLPVVVRDLLAAAGTTVTDLDLVAVSAGPGSFTGLRVGLGFAQGLATGASLQAVAVPSLDAWARVPERSESEAWVAVCSDARRGEVYLSIQEATPDGGWRTLHETSLPPGAAVETIVSAAGGRPGVLLGGASEAYSGEFARLGEEVRRLGFDECPPSATRVAEWASGAAPLRPQELMPRYLRPSQAEREASLTVPKIGR